MGDGAHLGVGPMRALKTILGGDPQPSDEERESIEEMRNRILLITRDQATDYDTISLYAAKLILVFLLDDPSRKDIPTENVYEQDASGGLVISDEGGLVLAEPGLYEVMKQAGEPWSAIGDLGLTGFMWGWACNAARRCLELPPVENPAILTI